MMLLTNMDGLGYYSNEVYFESSWEEYLDGIINKHRSYRSEE